MTVTSLPQGFHMSPPRWRPKKMVLADATNTIHIVPQRQKPKEDATREIEAETSSLDLFRTPSNTSISGHAAWSWDYQNELVEEGVFNIEKNAKRVTKIDEAQCYENLITVDATMTEGMHTISLKLHSDQKSSRNPNRIYAGVVRSDADRREDHCVASSTDGFFIDSWFGSLHGNGKQRDDDAGEIEEGRILTMTLDLNAGTLRFWLDGKLHGPGFWNGIPASSEGTFCWAASVVHAGCGLEIVPNPTYLEDGFSFFFMMQSASQIADSNSQSAS